MGQYSVIIAEEAKEDLLHWQKLGDKSILRKIDRIFQELALHPEIYVRKDDYKDIVRDIKEDMRERFDKIDTTMALIYKKFDEHIDKGS